MGAILAAALAVSAPAWAFSDSTDTGGSSSSSRDDDDRASSADYRYSGNSFNFSMSRNVAPQTDAATTQEPNAERSQQQQSRPGFFRRGIRSIFGD